MNIMLDDNYNIKLVSGLHNRNLTFASQIDFGDAKKLNEEVEVDSEDSDNEGFQDYSSEQSSDYTDRKGTFVGTVNYLAPEMI